MPSIERVEPYSSTALVEFDEPLSDGGVPVLRYKAEWRAGGAEWTTREYSAHDGEERGGVCVCVYANM